ncbi:enoyl-CoA hydratase [Streptomyces profundus]|uniref:enoyl-CoA hydratase n=1 Tax=Streptomyces profundus TaxID=2867410 RepID=UPI001D15EE91|nr:enoyl-CoA hydratase [Streptomyces sp. MA3_2.13]UED84451.1 enoyl-CoA hydratase/isomerase family protein [Streptomyces sp. MA3_2.13]
MSPELDGGVRVTRRGPVVELLLDNQRRRNALTFPMYEQLAAGCEVADEPGVRAVVLRGAGGLAFAAGTDIRHFADFPTDPEAAGEAGLAYERRVGRVLARLLALRAPLVGVVEGPAFGGGLALAAACDLLLATPDATFGAPIARTLGNCLPAPVVARLADRLGTARTMALLLTAEPLDAATAHTAGFVHRIAEPDELPERIDALLERLVNQAPLTLAALKETERRLSSAAARVDTDDLLRRAYGSADFRAGVAAFLDHRTPRWEGR